MTNPFEYMTDLPCRTIEPKIDLSFYCNFYERLALNIFIFSLSEYTYNVCHMDIYTCEHYLNKSRAHMHSAL